MRRLHVRNVDDAALIGGQLVLHDGPEIFELLLQILRRADADGKAARISEADVIALCKIHFTYILNYSIICKGIQ